jgi:hypothetical protein
MKKLFLTLMIIALMVPFAQARENVGSQTLFFNKPTTQDYKLIDVNSISAWVTNYGSIYRHPLTGNSGFEYPAGGGVFAIYGAGIWLGARPVIDGVVGSPRVAIAEYSYEFQPGKIIGGAPDDPDLARYQVYKWLGTDTPDQDAVDDGAPETLLGDQYLWSVYNDGDASYHVNMNTGPLMVEVQQSIFAFARTGPLGNTVFMKWLVVNKHNDELQDTYITIWCDPDLGDSGDDFVGCDTILSLGYCYNSSNTDGEYGAAPPATGFDFFQGPIVPSPGDTAYVSGQMFLDYKNLPMTSFVYYNNSNENNGNPQTGPECYNYMRARWRDGAQITEGGTGIDPNNPPTNYMFPGDPEAGTGWLDSSPADRRFMMSTGPFTLEPWVDTNGNGKEDIGEPGVQEIVAGAMVARGTDNLNSATLLKQYDELAQLAYDLNFNLAAPPPPPAVQVTLLDQQIILNWSNEDPEAGFTYKEVEAYDAVDPLVPIPDPENPPDTTYTFQGYLAYQFDFLDKRNAVEIGNWDLEDGFTEIRDFVLDEGTGEFLEKLVWKGNDAGLQRFLVIDEDKFSGSTLPSLINGKRYWFGVVAFGENDDSSPKMIQSPYVDGVNFVEVIPQGDPIGVKSNTDAQGQIIPSEKEGISDGGAYGLVVDPTKLTGNSYKITFADDADGHTFWTLTNTTLNTTVLDSQYYQNSDSNATAFPVADGIQWKVLGPPPGIKECVQVDETDWDNVIDSNLNFSLNSADRRAAGDASFFLEAQGNSGTNESNFARWDWQGNMTPNDYVIDFPEDPQTNGQLVFSGWASDVDPQTGTWLYRGWKFSPTDTLGGAMDSIDTGGRVPYRIWKVDLSGNATQIQAMMYDDNEDWFWDQSWETAFTDNSGFERIYTVDYPYDEAEILADGGDYVLNSIMWDQLWPSGQVLGRVIFGMYVDGYRDGATGGIFGIPPSPNTVCRWNTNKPNTTLDTYTFPTTPAPGSYNQTTAVNDIEMIKVYPNPYYGTHSNERLPTEKWVEFTHLPPTCTIRIFNLAGALVRTIVRSNVTDRTWERWDLDNESELPVASGLYIFHIDIPNVGEKVGKLVVFMSQERLDTF